MKTIIRSVASIRRAAFASIALAGLVLAGCDDDLAPGFTIDGTGTVEGLVFFDAGEDQVFDPADGDFAVEGVAVAVQDRGTGGTFSGGTAQSGADGRFLIPGVPAGTHDLVVDESTVPEGITICQNPLEVSVFIDETQFQPVQGRPGCLITIAEAQATAAGEFVIVEGVVTVFPSMFDFGDAIIQDETGGVWLLAGSLVGAGLEVGDLVEIGGTIDVDDQFFKLASPELRSVVKDVGVPDPMLVTTGQITAASDARDPLQHTFVRVEAAQLTSSFTSGGGRNATLDDGSGSVVIRVEDNVSGATDDGILADLGLTVGNCYDITGIVSAFRGTAQLFPRQPEDITEVPCG